MMTDPLADMLTRIRNAVRIEMPIVDMPSSRLRINVAKVLKDEGYIYDYKIGSLHRDDIGNWVFEENDDPKNSKPVLRLFLKYGPQGERVIQQLKRVSKPSCRVYRGYRELRPVLDGLGIAVVSTSAGVMSDRQARQRKLGGEVLCQVW